MSDILAPGTRFSATGEEKEEEDVGGNLPCTQLLFVRVLLLLFLPARRWMVDVWPWTVSMLLFGYPQLSLLTEEVRLHELAKSKTRKKKNAAAKKTD